jgi:PncC family amidohydrolase
MNIIEKALSLKATISTAESCTGGMIGAYLTSISGSSAVYEGGVVTYSNALKMKLLGVSRDVLREHGAVSAQCAKAMAEGVRELCNTTYSVAVTGIAGPKSDKSDKPVGLVFIVVATPKETIVVQKNYGDIGRENVRVKTRDDAIALFTTHLAINP